MNNIPNRFTLQNKETGYYISDRFEKLSTTFNPLTSLLNITKNEDGTYSIIFERTGLPLIIGFHDEITINPENIRNLGNWEVEFLDGFYNLCKLKHKDTNTYLKCGTVLESNHEENSSDVWSLLNKSDVSQIDMRIVSNSFVCSDEELNNLKMHPNQKMTIPILKSLINITN